MFIKEELEFFNSIGHSSKMRRGLSVRKKIILDEPSKSDSINYERGSSTGGNTEVDSSSRNVNKLTEGDVDRKRKKCITKEAKLGEKRKSIFDEPSSMSLNSEKNEIKKRNSCLAREKKSSTKFRMVRPEISMSSREKRSRSPSSSGDRENYCAKQRLSESRGWNRGSLEERDFGLRGRRVTRSRRLSTEAVTFFRRSKRKSPKRKRDIKSCGGGSAERSLSNVHLDTILKLKEIHLKECHVYRKLPKAHPMYEIKRQEWMNKIEESGLRVQQFVLEQEWNVLWKHKMEKLFDLEWEEKRQQCLDQLKIRSSSSSLARSTNDFSQKLPKNEIVELVSALNLVSDRLGYFGGLVSSLNTEVLSCCLTGRDPMECINSKIVSLFKVVNEKLEDIQNNENLSVEDTIKFQSACDKIKPFIFKNSKFESVKDLDIAEMARATIGKSVVDILNYIKEISFTGGLGILPQGELMEVYLNVRSVQAIALDCEEESVE